MPYKDKQKYAEYHKKYDKQYKLTLKGYLTRLYYSIKYRCGNPNVANFKWYGGRGIKCLFKSSREFVDYVINELRVDPRGLTIDRVNNDGNYIKGNIQFVSHSKNCNNKREKYQTKNGTN